MPMIDSAPPPSFAAAREDRTSICQTETIIHRKIICVCGMSGLDCALDAWGRRRLATWMIVEARDRASRAEVAIEDKEAQLSAGGL